MCPTTNGFVLVAAMLSGGTGDQNLAPLVTSEADVNDMLSRVRALLVFSIENRGPKVDTRSGLNKADVMVERWKGVFLKHDREGCGTLGVEDIKRMVRLDLKIAERLVSDDQIQALFSAIDEDSGGSVEFSEFLEFVQQPSTRGTITDQDVTRSVERSVRLALRRNKIRVKDLQANFHSFDETGDVPTGELGPNDMVRFFRKAINLPKHECTDKALHTAFHVMDDDGSGKMSLDELMDFLTTCSLDAKPAPLPSRIPGLIGGMRCGCMLNTLPERLPSRRPGTCPGQLSQLPFCLGGRDIASAGRLSRTSQRVLARADSEPSIRTLALKPSTLKLKKHSSCTTYLDDAGMWILQDAGSEAGDCLESQILSPKSVHKVTPPTQKRVWNGKFPSKTCGGYKLLKGAHALNKMEDRLLGCGIDVRGHYHRPAP